MDVKWPETLVATLLVQTLILQGTEAYIQTYLLCSDYLQWNIAGSFSLTEFPIMDMTTTSNMKHECSLAFFETERN